MAAESKVACDGMGSEGRTAFRRTGPRVGSRKTEVEILRDSANHGRRVGGHPDRHPPRCFGGELTRRKLFAEPNVPLLDVECRGAFHQTIALPQKSKSFLDTVSTGSGSDLVRDRQPGRYRSLY